jgi:hypothetical protein
MEEGMRNENSDSRRHLEKLFQRMPNHMYKYCGLSGKGLTRIVSYIEESKLYFARPTQLNDPFECRVLPTFDSSPDEIRMHWEEHGGRSENPELFDRRVAELIHLSNSPKDQEREAQRLYEVFEETTGMLSITERPDDLLMWPYYADSHAGVVLILHVDINNIAAFPEKPVPYPIQVDYANEMPEFFYYKADNEEYTRLAMGTKSKEWKHEREWRLISPNGCGEWKVPEGLICGVIFGLVITPQHKQTILDACSRANYPIETYQINRSLDRYALEISEIR